MDELCLYFHCTNLNPSFLLSIILNFQLPTSCFLCINSHKPEIILTYIEWRYSKTYIQARDNHQRLCFNHEDAHCSLYHPVHRMNGFQYPPPSRQSIDRMSQYFDSIVLSHNSISPFQRCLLFAEIFIGIMNLSLIPILFLFC